MSNRHVHSIILIIILIGVLGVSTVSHRVEAPYPIVYIKEDGSIDPATANITSTDNATYTFTADINAAIIVEKNNTAIDGAGFTLQGIGSGSGILLSGRSNIAIKNVNIKSFQHGIYLSSSSHSVISENNITNNWDGVRFEDSSNFNIVSKNRIAENTVGIVLYPLYGSVTSNNTISGNKVENGNDGMVIYRSLYNTICENTVRNNTDHGIYLDNTVDNKIYHNNFIDNGTPWFLYSSNNIWDADYPSGGNYWSDYTGADLSKGPFQNEIGRDGIGDTPYTMNPQNKDNYPLMGTFSSFNTSLGYPVNVVSNSSIESFDYFESNSTMRMRLSNMTIEQAFGFCRVTIPKNLMPPPYNVIIDDGLTQILNFNNDLYDNSTHKWIYFAYEHSTHKVVIQTDTAPPTISILHPQNKAHSQNTLSLEFTVDEPVSWIGYSLNGQANTTITGNTILSDLSDGQYYIVVYANDTVGNMGASNTIHFSIDTTPPTANAGPDQTVNEDTLVAFDGSASTDENSIITYTWTFTDVTLKTLTGDKPTYTFTNPGVYTITLNVSDAAGNWATDTVIITVNPTETFPTWIVPVAGIVTVGIVTAAIILWRKRKRD